MKRKSTIFIGLIIVLLIAYAVRAAIMPMPTVAASSADLKIPASTAPQLVWPSFGQAAVGALGYGTLATNGEQKSTPIASIAKTMLALSVLKQKPLKVGEQGPTLTITQQDADLYHTYLAQNGSIVPINVGEQISEYQMLQALLLPSGDNIADSLAIWAFGSVDAYLKYANDQAATLGLKQTHFADASGISAQTVSSAEDLTMFAQSVMAEPVVVEIVGQSKITLPVMGPAFNYNTILGQSGIVGIKTGNTDEAGGCFMFASKTKIDGQDVTLIGAILGASNLSAALQSTLTFLQSNAPAWHMTTVAKAGQTVGTYNLPWGQVANAVAEKDVSVLTIGNQKVTPKVDLVTINSTKNKGDKVGTISVQSGTSAVSVPLILDSSIAKPSFFWKLIHPKN